MFTATLRTFAPLQTQNVRQNWWSFRRSFDHNLSSVVKYEIVSNVAKSGIMVCPFLRLTVVGCAWQVWPIIIISQLFVFFKKIQFWKMLKNKLGWAEEKLGILQCWRMTNFTTSLSISSNVGNKLAEMLPTLCPSTSNVFERAMFFENYNFVNLCSLLKVQTSVRWATPARLAGATIFSAAQGVSSTMRCRRAGAADPPAIARRSAWSEMPSKGALCCLPTKTGVEMRKPGRSKTEE